MTNLNEAKQIKYKGTLSTIIVINITIIILYLRLKTFEEVYFYQNFSTKLKS